MDTKRPEEYHEETTADPAAQTYLGPIDPVSDTTANTVPDETRLPLDHETTRDCGETISKTAGTIAPFEPAPTFNAHRYRESDEAEEEAAAGSGS